MRASASSVPRWYRGRVTSRAEALAGLAVATPSVDAPAALAVLVDAMLEDAMLEPDRAEAQLRRAWVWARHRFAQTPLEQFAAILVTSLAAESELPPFVVGVVRSQLVRLHFLAPVPACSRERIRAIAASAASAAYYLEVTARAS